jgi:hypothetical protein
MCSITRDSGFETGTVDGRTFFFAVEFGSGETSHD